MNFTCANIPIFRVILEGNPSMVASQLTKILMTNYYSQTDPPCADWNTDDSGSIVIGVASMMDEHNFKRLGYC